MGPVHFTRLLLFFEASNYDHPSIRSRFTDALIKMVQKNPFLAGTVKLHEAHGSGHRALFYSPEIPADFDPEAHGMLKFEQNWDDYVLLRQSRFPGSRDEATRYHWLEKRLAAGEIDALPVIAFQMTFMYRGLVLAFWSHHFVLDGASKAQVLGCLTDALNFDKIANDYAAFKARPIDVEKQLGFQGRHTLRSSSDWILRPPKRPAGIGFQQTITDASEKKSAIVAREVVLRIPQLQRIRRLDGSTTSPFRCAVALLLVAIIRARVDSGYTSSTARTSVFGAISNFRGLGVAPHDAMGNYSGHTPMEIPIEEMLCDEPLSNIPPILSATLEEVCEVIKKSKSPSSAYYRRAWLTHQIYDLGKDPRTIVYAPEADQNPIIFNTWELLGLDPDSVNMLGELQCVRKPCMPSDGYVLFMPHMRSKGSLTCTVGLSQEAMRIFMRLLDGWNVSSDFF